MIYAQETCYVDRNKAYIKRAHCSALNSFSQSILEDVSEIQKSLGAAIVHVATNEKRVTQIADLIANNHTELDPIAKFAVEAVELRATKSVNEFQIMGPPWSTLSDSVSFSNKRKKKSKERRSEQLRCHWSASAVLSSKGTATKKYFTTGSEHLLGEKESLHNGTAPRPKNLHATDSHFRRVTTYKCYRLPDTSQTYNRKTVAKSGKYVKQMETSVKHYKLDGKNPATLLRF